jgi:ubiquinone/menaquinone biosynthesis C-methylase UbiE
VDHKAVQSNSTHFDDRFSQQAAAYARHRPAYPDSLFEWLSTISRSRKLAWDCATGSGQAAISLCKHFEHVLATDASASQIANAISCEGVEYRAAPAESSGLQDGSVSLITVASALHWFNIPAFFAEARRVLCPGGIIAVWGYRECEVAPQIDPILQRYQDEVVGPYWSPKIRIVAEKYRTIAFPFQERSAPAFSATAMWTSEDMLGYLNTWSASQAFLNAHKERPTDRIAAELQLAWGTGQRRVEWPLFIRIGSLSPAITD